MLDVTEIREALTALNDPLALRGVRGETCVFGGPAMALAFQARQSAVESEPPLLDGIQENGAMMDAFLVATAEALSARRGWSMPDWIFEDSRYLRRPFFPIKAVSFRATLLLESPPEFRSRNLFVTANALFRV